MVATDAATVANRFAFCVLVPVPVVAGSEYQGKAVRILDGDTIEVLSNKHSLRIRLSGIDCPEKGQAYGKKAKQAESTLVFGKQITLQTHDKDKYRRTLADVLCWMARTSIMSWSSKVLLVVSEVCAQ